MEFKDRSAQSGSQNKETQEGEERPLDERVSANRVLVLRPRLPWGSCVCFLSILSNNLSEG